MSVLDSGTKITPLFLSMCAMNQTTDLEPNVTTEQGLQNAIKVREFKTATGVISFLVGVGFPQASIPMKNGEKTSHRLVSD